MKGLYFFILLLLLILIATFLVITKMVDVGKVTYEIVEGDSGGSAGGGGGGGGGGGSVSTPSLNETKSIEQASPSITSIFKDFNPETGIKQIEIKVKNEILNLRITVSKYDGLPEAVSVEKSGKIYRYLHIDAENLNDNLENATITFQVEKIWLSQNNLSENDISLFRFDENSKRWDEIETSFSNSDDVYNYYETILNRFSYFAIATKINPLSQIAENKGFFLFLIIVVIFIIAIIIILSIILYRRKKADISV